MGRAPCCDKANVKRGPWSPEEDAALRSYVERHGTGGNWIAFPHKAGLNRCGKSCRLRWLNYLRPDIKHGGFTEEEDSLICTLYNNIGSRWSVIASQLPGRTDNDVKNYWNTKLKKRVMAGGQPKVPSPHQTPPPPLPPPPRPSMPAVKAEDLSMPLDSGFGYNQDSYRFLVDLPPPFPMPELIEQPGVPMNGYVVTSPPADNVSAASSSVENSSSNSCINWPDNGASLDDGFLSELGFIGSGDFLGDFSSQERLAGEVAPYYHLSSAATTWASSGTKPQGLYQSFT